MEYLQVAGAILGPRVMAVNKASSASVLTMFQKLQEDIQ